MPARRAWLIVISSVIAALAVGAPPALAGACGQTINLPAEVSAGPGPPPLAIGDSVLYDAARPLARSGFTVNAMVCRTMSQGIALLEQERRALPALVVVALGTNGAVSEAQIGDLLSIVGPQRMLALVTPHHGNDPAAPALYRAIAQRFSDRVLLLDWDRLSAGHPDWFAPDGIHLGSAAGVDAFAQLIANSLLAAPVSQHPAQSGQSQLPAPSATKPSPRPKPKPRPAVVRPSPTAERASYLVWLAVSATEVSLSLLGA